MANSVPWKPRSSELYSSRICRRRSCAFAIASNAPSASFVPDLRELRLQRLLVRDERAEELAILEPEVPAAERLVAVLHVEQVSVRGALLLGAEELVPGEQAAQLGEPLQPLGEHDVALHLELGDGELPIGAAGVAGDEGQLARLRPLGDQRKQFFILAGFPPS